jgi:hypothetical protein
MDHKIAQWKRELELITNDVTDIIESQFIFKRVVDIVGANPKINTDNLFWDHLRANFGAYMVLGIARQVDERTEVVSLLKLLENIRANYTVLTRDWYAGQYEPNLPRQIGEQHFAEHFGAGAELDPAIVEHDIRALESATAKVERFRHTRIAHKNADERLVIELDFTEVETALKVVEDLVIKYQLLLNQAGYDKLMPTITYNWESIFKTPWIEVEGR